MLTGEQHHYSQGNDPSHNPIKPEQAQVTPQTTQFYTFSLHATTPPPTDPPAIMQRADEVNTIQRMMSDPQTSAVMVIGEPGSGKSTLVALLFRRLQRAKEAGLPAPQHLIWLSLGTFTTLPDMIASILSKLNISDPGFFLLKPE